VFIRMQTKSPTGTTAGEVVDSVKEAIEIARVKGDANAMLSGYALLGKWLGMT